MAGKAWMPEARTLEQPYLLPKFVMHTPGGRAAVWDGVPPLAPQAHDASACLSGSHHSADRLHGRLAPFGGPAHVQCALHAVLVLLLALEHKHVAGVAWGGKGRGGMCRALGFGVDLGIGLCPAANPKANPKSMAMAALDTVQLGHNSCNLQLLFPPASPHHFGMRRQLAAVAHPHREQGPFCRPECVQTKLRGRRRISGWQAHG